MSPSAQLEALATLLQTDTTLPLYAYRIENSYHPVIGEGSPTADIMLVGEAPGEKEALSGKPFCGAAGRIVSELVASIQLSREEIYITNIVKDRPPKNRDPLPAEIEAYAPYLDKQMDIIQPRVIGTLGRFSSEYVMKRYGLEDQIKPISDMHGSHFTTQRPWGHITIVPLYHPAVALYRNSMKPILLEDFGGMRRISE